MQEPARPTARPTRRASAAFMEMLRGATDPPVTSTTSTWTDVSAQFEADMRCAAIPEAQRPQMFDTFKAALVQVEEARAAKERAAATDNFKVSRAAVPSPLQSLVNPAGLPLAVHLLELSLRFCNTVAANSLGFSRQDAWKAREVAKNSPLSCGPGYRGPIGVGLLYSLPWFLPFE